MELHATTSTVLVVGGAVFWRSASEHGWRASLATTIGVFVGFAHWAAARAWLHLIGSDTV